MAKITYKDYGKTNQNNRDCYCEDHALELKGVHGTRWPVDATKYTFHMCYRCGRTWMTPEASPRIPVKTARVPSARAGSFAVYKITDGVMGYEQLKEAPVKVHPKKATKWLPFRKAT